MAPPRGSTKQDAMAQINSLRSAYISTPTNLKIIDLYIVFAVSTALIQVAHMATVGSFPFNSFLSGVLSCVGTAVLAGESNVWVFTIAAFGLFLLGNLCCLNHDVVCLRVQVNKETRNSRIYLQSALLQTSYFAI